MTKNLLKYFHPKNKKTHTFQKKYMKMYMHLVRKKKKQKNLDSSVLVHRTQWHFCISLLCHLLPYLGFYCAFVGEAKWAGNYLVNTAGPPRYRVRHYTTAFWPHPDTFSRQVSSLYQCCTHQRLNQFWIKNQENQRMDTSMDTWTS